MFEANLTPVSPGHVVDKRRCAFDADSAIYIRKYTTCGEAIILVSVFNLRNYPGEGRRYTSFFQAL